MKKTILQILIIFFVGFVLLLVGNFPSSEEQRYPSRDKTSYISENVIGESEFQTYKNLIQRSLNITKWDVCHVEYDDFRDTYTHYPKGWFIYTIKNDSHLVGTPAFHFEQGCSSGGRFLTSPTPMTNEQLFVTWMKNPEIDALLPKTRVEIVYLDYRSQPQKPVYMFTRSEDGSLFLAINSKNFGIQVHGYNISAELMTLFTIKNLVNITY